MQLDRNLKFLYHMLARKSFFLFCIFFIFSCSLFADEEVPLITLKDKFVYIFYPSSMRTFVIDTVTNTISQKESKRKTEAHFAGIEYISNRPHNLEPPENVRVLRRNKLDGVLIRLEWTKPSFGIAPKVFLISRKDTNLQVAIHEDGSNIFSYEESLPYPFEPFSYILCSVDESGEKSETVNIFID